MRGEGGTRPKRLVALVLLLGAALLQGCSPQPAPVRIGVLADCVGFFRNLQDAALTGAELPFLERGAVLRGSGPSDGVTAASVAGHPVELVSGCIEGGEYASVIEQARLLIEVDDVDVVIGGTWPGDGMVLREVARKHPETTVVVSNSGYREVTATDAAPNVYRFAADLSQQVAGLGSYAYRDLGWRHALVVADPNEIGWGGSAAFLAEFCALGGLVTQASLAADGPPPTDPDADGVAVFFTQFGKTPAGLAALAGGRKPLGSSLLLGPAVWSDLHFLAAMPSSMKDIVTTVPAGGTDFTSAAAGRYLEAAARHFPGAGEVDVKQSFVVQNYDAVEVVMRALEQTAGTVGPGGAVLRQALGELDTDLVSGRVHLDANRAAVVATALVRLGAIGTTKVLRTVPDVDQTIGGALPASYQPAFGEQPCVAGTAPPWAR